MRDRRDAAPQSAHARNAGRVECRASRYGRPPAGVSGMSLVDRDRACLWHPYTQMHTAPPPLPIVRGEGVYLYTEDGRNILDGISSWWVNIHGHSHPQLNQALAAQAREIEHVVFAGCTHRPAVELAEALLQVIPPGLTRIFYSDDGSTAVEVALKMALQYWRNRGQPQRAKFITRLHAAAVSGAACARSLLLPVPAGTRARVMPVRLPRQSGTAPRRARRLDRRGFGRTDASRRGRDDRLAGRVSLRRAAAVRPSRRADDRR